MSSTFLYRGARYPDYIRRGNAMRFIEPFAKQFCIGRGIDVGGGSWPLPGAQVVDVGVGVDAYHLPAGCDELDYIFSSHCLEHLENTVRALEHWQSRLRSGGVLFLYLPHPDMIYWRPQNCRKHLHTFYPADMERMLSELGFDELLRSERDLAWSFAVVGRKP